MELYLDCDSIKLWNIVRKGWELSKATNDGMTTLILRDDWNAIQQEGNHKKGYDYSSLFHVQKRRRQASILYFG